MVRSTILFDLLLIVDADRDQPRLLEAGGAQHVEPRAVAVIDLEAEAAGDLDHVGVEVDRRHVDPLGEQKLRHDLSEPAEADHQHGAVRVGEVVGLALRRLVDTPHQHLGEAREGGPISSVTAAIADSRLPCAALRMPSATPSGNSTNANSPAPVSTEPACNASPRRAQVARNSAHTTPT